KQKVCHPEYDGHPCTVIPFYGRKHWYAGLTVLIAPSDGQCIKMRRLPYEHHDEHRPCKHVQARVDYSPADQRRHRSGNCANYCIRQQMPFGIDRVDDCISKSSNQPKRSSCRVEHEQDDFTCNQHRKADCQYVSGIESAINTRSVELRFHYRIDITVIEIVERGNTADDQCGGKNHEQQDGNVCEKRLTVVHYRQETGSKSGHQVRFSDSFLDQGFYSFESYSLIDMMHIISIYITLHPYASFHQ